MKANYLLTESLISTLSVYLILKKLMSPWEEWDAYKLGIIDKNGSKKKHPVTSKEREAWDMLTRICWNIKKITTKFIGKGKFAQNFTAAYLLKDSINPYIILNQTKLNETLLADMTFNKQSILFDILQDLPQHNLHITMPNNLVEVEIYKALLIIEKVLQSHEDINLIFPHAVLIEDDSGATVQADIAQHGQYLGATKKEDPMKLAKSGINKLKKKRGKKHAI